jgi:hypothetical protein
MLWENLYPDIYSLLIQRGLWKFRFIDLWKVGRGIRVNLHWFLLLDYCLADLLRCLLLLLFELFSPTVVKKGKGSIKTIPLTGIDEIVDIQIVGVFTTCACIEIQFSYLNLAANRKRILKVLGCTVDWWYLRKEVPHFVHREIALILFEFFGKDAVEGGWDTFFRW